MCVIVNSTEVQYVQTGVRPAFSVFTIPYLNHFNDAGGEKSTCII